MKPTPPLSIEKLDLDRYVGRWHEIASYPKWFERGMTHVQAQYTLNEKGYIDILNSGIKGGKLRRAKGKAKVVDTRSNAKLKVSFFGPFYAPYWVIDLADDYTWAVVSDPLRRTLWILSRTPQIEDTLYELICLRIASQGYDLSRLVKMDAGVK